MLRPVSSRNNRSKGFKVKDALQLFLLLAVTVWLLYQVKHSYYEKKSYDGNKENSLSSIKDELSNTPGEELIRFGRKDLADTEIKQKSKKNKRKVTKISERDTNLDETYGDEEIAEIIEEAEAEETDDSEKGEIEKDGRDADAEETSLLEDEEIGKDKVREARERTFHQDNVASAVAHDVNMTSWHEDYLESKERNLTNVTANNESSVPSLMIGNGLENRTDSGTGTGTGSLTGLKDKPVSVNLTNGIVVTLNETGTISSTPDLNLNVEEKDSKVNPTMVNRTHEAGTTGTSVSLDPVSKVNEREDDSHIKFTGSNGGDVVLE
ncbi:hypothetical protein FCM35_KLT15179 [Carex littledalei]|uniref:Uncharacterized protein n=1 Tax=Carex littledalei TaxID=544730 RepID=A0A833QHK3_9POAL|nr:hypothetical protein FCM35_KLT15179 [Carex littledalei]